MSHVGPDVAAVDTRWRGLYKTGAVAALLVAGLIVLGIVTFIAWPPPRGTVAEWFALFQRNWLEGMLGLDLVILVSYIVLVPELLALYIALRRASESLMALAAAYGLIGVTTYFASSRVFEMLDLSRQYAVATTDAQRAALEAAGQAMLTYLGPFANAAVAPGWNYQSTAFNLSFVLWSAAGIMIGVAMLRSAAFGNVAGYFGIAGNAAAFGLFVPVIGVWLSLLALPLLMLWHLLIARGLFRLASHMP
jgi:hypothetical protein